MKQIKGILFDFNGTLFFDSFYHLEAFQRCFEARGMERRSEEYIIRNMFGRTNNEIYLKNYDASANADTLRAFEDEKEKKYMDFCLEDPSKLHLCDGACEMLDYLKENGIPYCIATGSPLENVKFYFEHLGLSRWFTMDNIVYCDGSFAGKPAPDIYQIAAGRLSLDASECAVFEDGTSGMRSARAANVARLIAVYQSGFPDPETENVKADEVHHDLLDWRGILERMGL